MRSFICMHTAQQSSRQAAANAVGGVPAASGRGCLEICIRLHVLKLARLLCALLSELAEMGPSLQEQEPRKSICRNGRASSAC